MNRTQILERLRAIREEMRSAEGANFEALRQEAETLKTQLQQIEAREAIFAGLNLDTPAPAAGPAGPTTPVERRGAQNGDPGAPANETPEQRTARVLASPEYRSAWLNTLRGVPLNDAERRAMSTAENSAGPAVPTTTANMIMERLEQTTALYPLVSKSEIPGMFKMPVESAAQAAAWHPENAAIEGTDPGLGDVTFGGFELVKLVTVSKAAAKMTIDAFESFIVNQIVRKMSIAIEASIASGSGSGEPTGILNGVTFEDNKVTYEKGGSMTYDTIMSALAALASPYHAGAVWVCSTKTKYKGLKSIRDNEGRPMFTDGRIDGKDVVVDDQIPDGKVLLGNLKYYHINMQAGIQIDVSEQSGFRNAQIDYRGYAIIDGKPLLDEAFVLIEEAEA